VSAKLSGAAAVATSGALPENVNYAVKSSFLLSFRLRHGRGPEDVPLKCIFLTTCLPLFRTPHERRCPAIPSARNSSASSRHRSASRSRTERNRKPP
jgi:hypothetical protein